MFEPAALRSEAVEILDPIKKGASTEEPAADRDRSTAPRPASLNGQVLAVIDNRAGRRFVEPLLEVLRSRFDFEDVIYVLKDTVNVPPRREDWQEVVRRGTVGLALYGA